MKKSHLWVLIAAGLTLHAQVGAQTPGTPASETQDSIPQADLNRAAGAPPFAEADPEDITNENYPDLIESFDYPNAEIADVIKAISKLTGKNFIIDPGVRGKISIIAPSQITVAEAWKAFLSALAINGFTVVPSGSFLQIKQARNAQRSGIDIYSGEYFPNTDQMITRIIKLKYISADEVNKRLRILSSKEGEITPYEPTNSLIISDFGSNVERIEKILTELDRPGFEERVVVIPVRHAKAKNISELIDQIINKGESDSSSRLRSTRFRSRRANTESSQGGVAESLSMVAPDDRTNAIIVVGNEAGIEKVRNLVQKLDYPLDPSESGGVYVYYVRHGEAKLIAETLSGIAKEDEQRRETATGGSTSTRSTRTFVPPTQQTGAVFGGDVQIIADENTNSLIITASRQDYEVVLNLLNKIDIAKDQVYVEAVILEMNNSNGRSWNLAAIKFLESQGGDSTTGNIPPRIGFNSRERNLLDLFNPGATGAILGWGSNKTYTINMGSQTVQIPDLMALISFVTTHTDSNILSTPQVIALDNEEAEIEVGEKVPIAAGVPQLGIGGTVATTTPPQFEDATIKLKIKPFISPDTGVVRLNVEQTIKRPQPTQIEGADALNATTQSLRQRAIKTNIVLTSGDTAVLGGLIEDRETIEETKIPLLGDIPILGWLFKGRSVSTNKVNLVVFLTPRIIRNPIEQRAILEEKLGQRVDYVRKYSGGRDPYGETFEKMRARSQQAPTTFNEPAPLPLETEPLDLDIEEAEPESNFETFDEDLELEFE